MKKLNTSDRAIFNKPYWKALNFNSIMGRPLRTKKRKRGKNKRIS